MFFKRRFQIVLNFTGTSQSCPFCFEFMQWTTWSVNTIPNLDHRNWYHVGACWICTCLSHKCHTCQRKILQCQDCFATNNRNNRSSSGSGTTYKIDNNKIKNTNNNMGKLNMNSQKNRLGKQTCANGSNWYFPSKCLDVGQPPSPEQFPTISCLITSQLAREGIYFLWNNIVCALLNPKENARAVTKGSITW